MKSKRNNLKNEKNLCAIYFEDSKWNSSTYIENKHNRNNFQLID